jgi:hypothetical protein
MAPRKPRDLERKKVTTKTDQEYMFWGYEGERNGSLQSVKSLQLATNVTGVISKTRKNDK